MKSRIAYLDMIARGIANARKHLASNQSQLRWYFCMKPAMRLA